MASEEYQVGYSEGYQDGWNAAQQPQAEAVWVNPELEHMAEEAECVSMCLNDRSVPAKDGSKPLSLWGRVEQYAHPRFLEGMATKDPQVSSEHIKALAKASGLIGSYTTAEFVRHVVGFAHVLLGNKAVQEAFVKANTHLLYPAPQQAEAVPPTHVLVPKRMTKAMEYVTEQENWTWEDLLAAAEAKQAESVPSDALGAEWTPCIKRPVIVHVRNQRPGEQHVSTREGITPVKPDDLIMRGVSGEEYPIGRAIFEQTYDIAAKGANHG